MFKPYKGRVPSDYIARKDLIFTYEPVRSILEH